VYHCPHISRFQPLPGNVRFQDHTIMLFDHSLHLNRICRYQPRGL
jgi:hypothetical protein